MARKKLDTDELLRVRRVAVAGLFGLYNHDVELRIADRVTILHGPNGVGKTALLRLIAGLFTGRYSDFTKYRFARLGVELTDGSSITVQPSDKHGSSERNEFELKISHEISGKKTQIAEVDLGGGDIAGWAARYASEDPYLMHLSEDRWYDRRSGDELTAVEVFHRYGEAGSRRRLQLREPYIETPWLADLRERVQVYLIETQRLLRVSPTESPRYREREAIFLPTVRDYAKNLSSKIKDALARYGTESQSLDQSFPERLLKAVGAAAMPQDELKRRMTKLNQQRAELQKIGLLDPASTSPFDVASLDELGPEQSTVMRLYVEDTEKKLAVLDTLARRITLLLENVNQKFKHKSVRVEREKGFVALGYDGSQLDPDSLSSGEQHELVLLYDLLFRVGRGALVLIDEPELSLHVGWQKRFLPDLLEIVRTAELDAIIATHSPFIVGDRSDLTVALAGDIDA